MNFIFFVLPTLLVAAKYLVSYDRTPSAPDCCI